MAPNKLFSYWLISLTLALFACNDLHQNDSGIKSPSDSASPVDYSIQIDSICQVSFSSFLKKRQTSFSEYLAISDSLLPCLEASFDLRSIQKAKYSYGMVHEKYCIHCFSFLFKTKEIELISTWNTQGVMIDSIQSIRRSKIDSTFHFRSRIIWAPVDSSITFWIEKYSLESAKNFEHPDQMLIDTLINYHIDDDGVLTRFSSGQKQ